MKALLMVGERLVGVHFISRPLSCLKYHVRTELSAATSYYQAMGNTSSTTGTTTWDTTPYEFEYEQIVFRFVRQVGPDEYEYQYSQKMTKESYKFRMYHRVEELEEPTEAISLNRLVGKMRKKEDMSELLSRYLVSEHD